MAWAKRMKLLMRSRRQRPPVRLMRKLRQRWFWHTSITPIMAPIN